MGDLLQARSTSAGPAQIQRIQVGRSLQVVARQQQLAGRQRKAVHGAGAGQAAHLAVGRVDREQRVLALVVGGGIQGLAVCGNRQAAGRAIPFRIHLVDRPGGQVHRLDREAIRLEARGLHGQVIQRLAVGRWHRISVPGLVVGREIGGLCGAIHRHAINVEIGRPRLAGAGNAHVEIDALAIRRERKLAVVAKRLARHVAIDAAGQQGRLGRQLAVRVKRPHEQLVARAVGPGVPMPHEQFLVQACHWPCPACALPRAARCRPAWRNR